MGRELVLRGSKGRSRLRPYKVDTGNRQYGMNQLGDLRFVRVPDNEGDTGESGDFFGSALGVAAGDEDARGRIGRVDFADGVAGLDIGGGSDCACVDNHDVGRGSIWSGSAALFAELALNCRAISLGGPATELFDVKGAHRKSAPEFYLSIRAHAGTEALQGNRFTTGKGAYTILGFHDTHKKKSIPIG